MNLENILSKNWRTIKKYSGVINSTLIASIIAGAIIGLPIYTAKVIKDKKQIEAYKENPEYKVKVRYDHRYTQTNFAPYVIATEKEKIPPHSRTDNLLENNEILIADDRVKQYYAIGIIGIATLVTGYYLITTSKKIHNNWKLFPETDRKQILTNTRYKTILTESIIGYFAYKYHGPLDIGVMSVMAIATPLHYFARNCQRKIYSLNQKAQEKGQWMSFAKAQETVRELKKKTKHAIKRNQLETALNYEFEFARQAQYITINNGDFDFEGKYDPFAAFKRLEHIIRRQIAKKNPSFENNIKLLIADTNAQSELFIQDDIEWMINHDPEHALEYNAIGYGLISDKPQQQSYAQRIITISRTRGINIPNSTPSKNNIVIVQSPLLGNTYIIKTGNAKELEDENRQTNVVRRLFEEEPYIQIPHTFIVAQTDLHTAGNPNNIDQQQLLIHYETGESAESLIARVPLQRRVELLKQIATLEAKTVGASINTSTRDRNRKATNDLELATNHIDLEIEEQLANIIEVLLKFSGKIPSCYDRDSNLRNALIQAKITEDTDELFLNPTQPTKPVIVLLDWSVQPQSDAIYSSVKLIEMFNTLPKTKAGIDWRKEIIAIRYNAVEIDSTDTQNQAHYFASIPIKAAGFSAFMHQYPAATPNYQQDRLQIQTRYWQTAHWALEVLKQQFRKVYTPGEMSVIERFQAKIKQHTNSAIN